MQQATSQRWHLALTPVRAAVRLWLDRRVHLPKASNAVANFDAGMGWTFFDLTQLHDEYRDSPVSVIEADFYHSSPLMAMSDEEIVAKVLPGAGLGCRLALLFGQPWSQTLGEAC